MAGSNEDLEKLLRQVMLDASTSLEKIYSEASIFGMTREEVDELWSQMSGGDQPPFHGAGVPKRPLPSEGSGSFALPHSENSDDEVK